MEVLDSPTLGSSVVAAIRCHWYETRRSRSSHTPLARWPWSRMSSSCSPCSRSSARWRMGDRRTDGRHRLCGTLAAAGRELSLVADPNGLSDDTTDNFHELYLWDAWSRGRSWPCSLIGMGRRRCGQGFSRGGSSCSAMALPYPSTHTTGRGEAEASRSGRGLRSPPMSALDLRGRPAADPRRRGLRWSSRAACRVPRAGDRGGPRGPRPGRGTRGDRQVLRWGLGPEPLAAFAGGVYVGAAALYAIGLPPPWRRVRAWSRARRSCPSRCCS